MKESEIKQRIARTVRMEGGYARRIEDRFAVGMPDMAVIPLNCPVVWLEAKILQGNILRPTDRQYVEMIRLTIPPHSIALMIGWKDGILYIAPPIKGGLHIAECMRQEPAETPPALVRRAIMKDTRYVVPQKTVPGSGHYPGGTSPPSVA